MHINIVRPSTAEYKPAVSTSHGETRGLVVVLDEGNANSLIDCFTQCYLVAESNANPYPIASHDETGPI